MVTMDNNLLFRPIDQATELELVDQKGYRFNGLYKNNDRLMKKHEQRRNEILTNRSSKRDKLIASIRRMVADVTSEDENHETTNSMTNSPTSKGPSRDEDIVNKSLFMDSNCDSLPNHTNDDSKSSNTNNRSNQEDRKFRNKAMLSEWLVDRPMNFESEWVVKATPVGRRCLVFARKGVTIAYSRTGQFVKKFQSPLPGGSHTHQYHCRRQFAIVDCIYVQHSNTFYLMDALAWNDQKLYESEASFRFFWLQSKYNENVDKFITINSKDESRFYCLNTYPATDQDILTALNQDPLIKEHNLQLDGLLFFHIRGPYVPGANPLVLWIKPDMAHRVLNVSS